MPNKQPKRSPLLLKDSRVFASTAPRALKRQFTTQPIYLSFFSQSARASFSGDDIKALLPLRDRFADASQEAGDARHSFASTAPHARRAKWQRKARHIQTAAGQSPVIPRRIIDPEASYETHCSVWPRPPKSVSALIFSLMVSHSSRISGVILAKLRFSNMGSSAKRAV